jgi:cytochrome c
MGLRNPYSVRVENTGVIYLADVGPQGADSILTGPSGGDQLYITSRAANFGFPMFVDGLRPYPIYDYAQQKVVGKFDIKAPVNFSRFNTGLDTLPVPKPAAAVSHWQASLNTPGWFSAGAMSLMSGPIYHYDGANPSREKFPPHFDGKWILADEQQNLIKAATLQGEQIAKVQNIFTPMKFSNPIDMEFAPDGALWVIEYSGWNTSDNNTKITRISYAGSCLPTALAVTSPAGRKARAGSLFLGGQAVPVPAGARRLEAYALDGARVSAQALDGEASVILPGRLHGLVRVRFGY